MPKQGVCPNCGAVLEPGDPKASTYDRAEEVVFAFAIGDTVCVAYEDRPLGKVVDRAVRPCHGKWSPWYKIESASPLWRGKAKWLSDRLLSHSNESG